MKKFFSVLFAVLALACLAGGLAACGGDGKTDYTVTVLSVGGDKIRNVSVGIHSDTVDESGVTDKTGSFKARLKPAEYTVTISDLPKGYTAEVATKKATADKPNVEFRLTSSIIKDGIPANYVYSVGDVMYDYEISTVDGRTTTFAELLEEKEMIFINLWATTCNPCKAEMPSMFEAFHTKYEAYETGETFADHAALVLISSWASDTAAMVQNFKNTSYPSENEAYWISDPSYCEHFSSGQSVPASIVVDRYGVMSFFHSGNMTATSDFTRIFDKYCSPNYSQNIERPDDGEDGVNRPLNPYAPSAIPSSNEIVSAVNGKNADGATFNGTYHMERDAEDKVYSWPWLIKEENGEKYLYNSNKGQQQYSFATVYLEYTAKKGDVLAFDYYADIENGYDVLYVLYNERGQVSTLTGKTDDWQTCYLDVAKEDGTYEVVFLYQADERNPENSLVEDIVKIKNIRLTNADEMTANNTYLDILFDCTSNFDEDRRVWTKHETVVLGDDKFFHVNDKNGPLVLLSTMTGTHWSNKAIYDYATEEKLNFGTGKNYNVFIYNYCTFAANSDYETYVPVTEELKDALDEITFQLGAAKGNENKRNENEWLETCVYFVRYGAGEVPKNPIAGMAPFTAFDLHETKEYNDTSYTEGIGNGDLNKIEIRKQPVPRGTYFKFTPATDGVYELRSFGDYATICWVVDSDEISSNILKSDFEPLNDESYYEKNFTEYVPMKAHHAYYVLLDLYDQADPTVFEEGHPGVLGTYYLSVRNMGERYTVLSRAALPNGYTTDGAGDDELPSGDIVIIPLGECVYTTDEVPMMQYKGNESKIFVDLLTPNTVTTDDYYYNGRTRMVSLADVFSGEEKTLERPKLDEQGNPVIGENGKAETETITYTYLKVPKYDADGNYVLDGQNEIVWEEIKYEGETLEYLRGLIEEAKSNNGTPADGKAPYGMVEVDAKLYKILEDLTHRFSDWRASQSVDGKTPHYVEDEWLQMCYYYKTYTITK